MNKLLFFLISLALSVAKVSCAEPKTATAAHTVALKALHDAVIVEIKGAAATEDPKPAIPLHVVIKGKKTIGKIRDFLIGAQFGATDTIHPEKAPGGSDEVLHFIVTTSNGRKVTFALIQGDDLVIPKLRESKSLDPNFIFPLGELLLHLQGDRKPAFTTKIR